MSTAIVKAAVDRAMKEGGLKQIEADIIEVENLFLQWSTDPKQSVNKLSDATGMTHKRIKEVLATGEFQRRYLEDTAGFREVAQEYTRARAADVMDAVIGRMAEIVEKGDPRDAIGAARVLTSMMENAAPKQVNVEHMDTRVLQIAAKGIETVEDLKKIMSAAADGNISRVEEERAARGRQA